MAVYRLEVVIEPDENGFHAYCPALKGCRTCSATRDEALQNIKEAAGLYLESLIAHGEAIPIGEHSRSQLHERNEQLILSV